MSELADRAEHIGAHLVGHALGAEVHKFDVDGRQSAVDFKLVWPDGRLGALEVTLITDPKSSAWQGLAAKDGWRWPAPSSWEFRLHGDSMPYHCTRRAVSKAIELCDGANVDILDQLPPGTSSGDLDVEWLNSIGELRRAPWGNPGVVLLSTVRAEFVEASTADFTTVVENWLLLPHIPRHVEKATLASAVHERHLFLVPVDEVLPARFFTNDFEAPTRGPEGFDGVDGIWIWSNYWHQYLVWRAGSWRWLAFPPMNQA